MSEVTVVGRGLQIAVPRVKTTKNFAVYQLPEGAAFIAKLYAPLDIFDDTPPETQTIVLAPGSVEGAAVTMTWERNTAKFAKFLVDEDSKWLGNLYFPKSYIEGEVPGVISILLAEAQVTA